MTGMAQLFCRQKHFLLYHQISFGCGLTYALHRKAPVLKNIPALRTGKVKRSPFS
uniref:Uncharacterized protein n=1 Tax=Romanomermis culicivorax TaxID=13658 RepID=A0A915JU23_ROMCU